MDKLDRLQPLPGLAITEHESKRMDKLGLLQSVSSSGRIVISIDVGLTWTCTRSLLSAFQFCAKKELAAGYLLLRQDLDLTQAAQEISVITNWPRNTDEFIPSRISYSPSSLGARQWGYDIGDGSFVLNHFVEGLRETDAGRDQALQNLSHFLSRSIGALPMSGHFSDLGMDALARLLAHHDRAAQDFLRHVVVYVRQEMLAIDKHLLDKIPVDVIATFPMVMFISL